MKMKRSWFRIKLRTLILLVAVIGLPIGLTLNRRSRFQRLADYHQKYASELDINYDHKSDTLYFIGFKVPPIQRLSKNRSIWHMQMFQKYQKAAVRPWMPVEAGPSPPA